MGNSELIDLEMIMDKLESIRLDCEYIRDEIETAEDEDMLEDACLYGISLIDFMNHSLDTIKDELNKGVK